MYRKKLGMLFAEALGAGVLTWVALTVSLSLGLPYFTSIAVGAALSLLVLLVGNASGAHVNPAVTLGFWTIRKIPTLQAAAYIIAQILGGFLAGKLFVYMTDKPLENIAGKSFNWKVLIAEAVGTFIFSFGIAAAVYQGYKGLRLAVTVGTSLFLGVLIASVASNGLLNPAMAIGMHSISKAYMFGPLLGAIVGMNVYSLLFADTAERVVRVRTTIHSAETVSSNRAAVKTKPRNRKK